MSAAEWNSRYVVYAETHGFDPATMLAVDRVLWPGGCMVGFMVWIGERWTEFRRKEGLRWDAPLGDVEHAAFDAWIGAR